MADVKIEKQDYEKDYVVREGRHVILRVNKTLKVVLVQRDRKIFFEKLRFPMNEAIGCSFGSVFEVKGDKLHRVNLDEEVDEMRNTENGDKGTVYQAIKSEGVTQKLSREDVVTLKAQGATGKDIVEQLVENSATFKDRTEFSKAKYRNKKTKKHNARITFLQPSTAIISEMYNSYPKLSSKVCDLRPDALSQILSLANVRATSKLLIMEQCQGLVVGAALERMAGYGDIVQIYHSDFPARIAMDYFDFAPDVLQTVHGYQLCKMNSIEEADPEPIKEEVMEVCEESEKELKSDDPDETKSFTEKKSEKVDNSMKEEEKIERKNKRKQEEKQAKNILQSKNMDGLIVVCKFHPSSIVLPLLDYVAPSRPFVIYSQYKEPLVECYNDLRTRGGVVNIQLTETWWRHYQVLPGRTHPLVTMDGSGGYLLSGITVERPGNALSTTVLSPSEKETNSNNEDETLEPPAKKFKDDK